MDRLRRWLAQRGVRRPWQVATLVVLAVAALFGGLDTVGTSVTPFSPGEEFDDGQFTVTVERASVVRELRAGTTVLAPETPGSRYLGVVATVRNNGHVPGTLTDEIDLRDQPDESFVAVMRLADGSRAASLGPGLQEQFAFVWKVPENALAPGDSVNLRVWRKTYTQGMVVYGQLWVDSLTDYGEVVVGVQGGSA